MYGVVLAEKDWKDSVKLSDVSDASLRECMLKILENNSHMYTGALGMIKETHHRIDFKEVAVPIRQQLYRAV